MPLTHGGRVTHVCVGKITIIGSDNGLSPGRRQAIVWGNAGILLIEPLDTNFSEILIAIHTFSFKKMHLNMSSGKWRPFCLGLNLLRQFYGLCLWWAKAVHPRITHIWALITFKLLWLWHLIVSIYGFLGGSGLFFWLISGNSRYHADRYS